MTKNKKNLAISDNMRQTKLKNNFSRVAEEGFSYNPGASDNPKHGALYLGNH
jgi:hypothetical protein